MLKARGGARQRRTPAFEKAQSQANAARAQRTRPLDEVLTREEKRQKRMAREVGISFRRPLPGTPMAAAAASTSEAPRRKTARELFLEEEARKARAQPVSSDESDTFSETDEPHSSLRDQIWGMFGKDRRSYMRDVDDSDDDMEAGASDVLGEERQSALEAIQEDQREEQALLERQRQKQLLRNAR